jgi:hypothetical protein
LKWKDAGNSAVLPRSMEVERKNFDVDIELMGVTDYAVYGLVYHYIRNDSDFIF